MHHPLYVKQFQMENFASNENNAYAMEIIEVFQSTFEILHLVHFWKAWDDGGLFLVLRNVIKVQHKLNGPFCWSIICHPKLIYDCKDKYANTWELCTQVLTIFTLFAFKLLNSIIPKLKYCQFIPEGKLVKVFVVPCI